MEPVEILCDCEEIINKIKSKKKKLINQYCLKFYEIRGETYNIVKMEDFFVKKLHIDKNIVQNFLIFYEANF